MSLFVCSYNNIQHCHITKEKNMLGFYTRNSGMLGSLERIAIGDYVLIRKSWIKNKLCFYGLFVVVKPLVVVGNDGERIWPDELRVNQVLYNLRVPVRFVKHIHRELSRESVLNLQWHKRYSPYTEYRWQGYMKLFSGNHLDSMQEEALCKLLDIEC